MIKATITAALLAALAFTGTAHAKHHHYRRHQQTATVVDANGSGVIRSHKTGAIAHVGASYTAQFQAYIDDLEANGAAIYFMGGIRPGRCWSGGLHPCGKALDVCQLARGTVAHGQVWHGRHLPDCKLPDRIHIAAIAAQHGLVEGGRWINSDYGHAQVGGYSGMALNEMSSSVYSARRHHRTHMVSVSAPDVSTDRLSIH